MKLPFGRRKAMMCRELVEVISDYLEGTLPPADRARFESHLAACDGCTRYLEQFRLTIEGAGRLRAEDLPEDLTDQLLATFRGWRG